MVVDPGHIWSAATGINGQGQVAGTSRTASGAHHAFLWTSQQSMVDRGHLGGEWSWAYDVGNGDQVVGKRSIRPSFAMTAFFWQAQTGAITLATLGAAPAPHAASPASATQPAGAKPPLAPPIPVSGSEPPAAAKPI